MCLDLITMVIFEHQCNTPLGRVLEFKHLRVAPTMSSKRHRACHKTVFSDEEYSGVTVNMTGCGRAQSAAPRYDLELKPEHGGVFRYTHSLASQLPLLDYDVNAEAFEAYFSIVAFSSTSSSNDGPASVNMAGTSEELDHQLEAYALLLAQ